MIENIEFLSKTNLDVPKYDFKLPNVTDFEDTGKNEELKEDVKKKQKVERLISKEEEPVVINIFNV
jgi:hypothetical protein